MWYYFIWRGQKEVISVIRWMGIVSGHDKLLICSTLILLGLKFHISTRLMGISAQTRACAQSGVLEPAGPEFVLSGCGDFTRGGNF